MKMYIWNFWGSVIAIYFGIFIIADCGVITSRFSEDIDLRPTNEMDVAKRPFCNAFTGCGRKRSSVQQQSKFLLNPQQQPQPPIHPQQSLLDPQARPQFPAPININALGQEEDMENSLSDLIDLNAEPAVEDLMRQIMSQAKLWEAIQEASREISLQRTGHPDFHDNMPITFNTQ